VARFLVITFLISSLALVVLMFSRFRKKLALAFKLIVAVYVVSALSRLWREDGNDSALMALAIALAGFGVLWGALWLYSNWILGRRHRSATASASGGAGSSSQGGRQR
jgi:hypothetical protein